MKKIIILGEKKRATATTMTTMQTKQHGKRREKDRSVTKKHR